MSTEWKENQVEEFHQNVILSGVEGPIQIVILSGVQRSREDLIHINVILSGVQRSREDLIPFIDSRCLHCGRHDITWILSSSSVVQRSREDLIRF